VRAEGEPGSDGGISRTVDVQLRVADDLLDLAVLLEVVEGFPCERTVDLETIDEGGDGDQAVGLNILLEAVVLLLVEDNSVLGLVLDCAACQWRFLQMITVMMEDSGVRASERGERQSAAGVVLERAAQGETVLVCVLRVRIAVSRTLALGPLLLLLLASGC
jgi:hypothetical protein